MTKHGKKLKITIRMNCLKEGESSLENIDET